MLAAMPCAAKAGTVPGPADEPADAAPAAVVTVSGSRQERSTVEDDPRRTPTSAYRVTGEQFEQQNVTSLEDLQQLVPGLNVQSTDPADMQITLRGIGDGGGQTSGEQNIGMPGSVAVYLDGVYLARPGMLSSLGDLAWADVLSGAQGTMFGANSTGGVLDLHTKEPTFVPEASISASVGQHDYERVRAVVSGPLSEHWAGRLNLISSSNGGAVTNVRNGHQLNGARSNGARGQLLFRDGDRFRLRLSADYNNANSEPTPVLVATHAVNGTDAYLVRSARVGNNVLYGSTVDLDDETSTHIVQGGVAARAEWLLGSGWRLRSITSYRYFHSAPSLADYQSVQLYANSGFQQHDRSWSQDLRVDAPTGGPVDYAFGLTYLGQKLEIEAHTRYADTTLPDIWLGTATGVSRKLDVIRQGLLRDRSLSPFAQGTWHAREDIDITAGVRFNHEERGGSFVRYNRSPFNSGYLQITNNLPSATVAATWRAAPGLSTYAAASYGEKAGGLNISSGAAAQAGLDSLIIRPEKARSGELGVKADLADNRLNLKADIFLSQVRDFQTQGYDPVDQQVYLLNAGAYISRGAEASVHWTPTRAWQIDASAVFNDTYYTDYRTARCPPEVLLAPNAPKSCDLSGEGVFNAPRVTANASVRYEWNAAGLKNFVAGRYAWRSWMYGTVDNSQFSRVPGYGLAAFSAGTSGRTDKGEWTASLWLNNAFDKTYYKRLVNNEYGSVTGYLGEQRTLGVTLGYRY
ncbi:iron complex outermembrane receptor protein [Pseudoduganella lurida]|uniref:Iron complex outermembrane receptor protein n=2 Tax=Pseudoduganella lurida TaxID=1036180 RepID=A0A562REH8_9BURK|nr:iron complex outermembrane receptor protein [Pseudoduganella lurida]